MPVENIKIEQNKPQWQHACQECLACLHFCPQKTIQFGENTINRNRYHHPKVTVKDMMAARV